MIRRLGRALLARETALELALGLGLITGGVALLSVAAGLIVLGAGIIAFVFVGLRP